MKCYTQSIKELSPGLILLVHVSFLVMKRNSLSPCEYKTLDCYFFSGRVCVHGRIISDGNSYGIPDDLLTRSPVTIKVRYYGFFSFNPLSPDGKPVGVGFY